LPFMKRKSRIPIEIFSIIILNELP